jgi:hypothetical protein
MSEELFDFRKVMEEQITLKVKPTAAKFGLKPAPRNTFVLEKDGVLFHLEFWFWRDWRMYSAFRIIPLCAVSEGMFNALPYCEYEKMSGEECIKPNAYISGEPRGKKETPEQAQTRKERVIREFDERFRYLESTLHYCDDINTFDEYMYQVLSNMEDMLMYSKREMRIEAPENYILGVYNCMKGNYEKGMIRLSQSIAAIIPPQSIAVIIPHMYGIPEMMERKLTLDEIENNDIAVLRYMCTKHILEAVENSAPTSRRESFQKAYEEVCQRMRRYYGIKCKK